VTILERNSGEPVGEERAGISVRGGGIGGNSWRNKNRKKNGEKKINPQLCSEVRIDELNPLQSCALMLKVWLNDARGYKATTTPPRYCRES